jgi:CheY-like chemotaxis protein
MLDTEPSAQGKVILVIEDSPTQAITVQSLLIKVGLRVLCATNGKDGVRLAKQVNPGLILLDIQMPDMNGFQVCELLKKDRETMNIPIIMLTRNDSPDAVKQGLAFGVVDYIPKDAFASAVLLETLYHMGFIKSYKHILESEDD